MSTIENTARAGSAGRLRVLPRLVTLAAVVALAVAAATAAVVGSSGPGASATQRAAGAAGAAAQRQFHGGPAEGRRLRTRPAPANDGSQHAGARP